MRFLKLYLQLVLKLAEFALKLGLSAATWAVQSLDDRRQHRSRGRWKRR